MEEGQISRKKILVAEDEPTVRDALKLLLTMDHHDVTVARNGKEALALFKEQDYDLVITDLSMPEMMGDELAKEIRARAPKQPIILATAHAENLSTTKSRVDAIIGKPVGFADLRKIIAGMLLL
jgi:two-component system capsular synthesis sensor histidine kinase RcsC